MKMYVQHDEIGNITGTVLTDGQAPKHPRQIVLDRHQDVSALRVDITTKELITCPDIAKRRRNADRMRQLQEIDSGTMRALRDLHLKGDSTALKNLEDKAEAIRATLEK